MSDRVAVMNNGSFEQIGNPQELYHRPKTAFVAGFVGDANRWQGKVSQSDGGKTVVETEAGMAVQCHAGTDTAITAGQLVEVFVRPEFIRLNRGATAATAHTSAMTGVVSNLLFNGANSRALVRLGSGDLVEVDVTLTGGTEDVTPGETVGPDLVAGKCDLLCSRFGGMKNRDARRLTLIFAVYTLCVVDRIAHPAAAYRDGCVVVARKNSAAGL